MEKIHYSGWDNCYRLSNGIVELIITSDIGPRIIRCGFINDKNLFYENPQETGRVGDNYWISYGGHRFWHAPENPIRTYYPDNYPVKIESTDKGLRSVQKVEETTWIQKSMELRIDNNNFIQIEHTLENCGLWPVKLAAWAISVMRPGGFALLPLPDRGSHPQNLNPTSTLILWPYTDLSDCRYKYEYEYIKVAQDPNVTTPQKIGISSYVGWLAYFNDDTLFVKYSPQQNEMTYPDLNSNMEVFVNQKILELETLSPLVEIAPGNSINHKEIWAIKKMTPGRLDAEAIYQIVCDIAPILQANM